MEKRLRLAKNLLKDTGSIFISIDDHEYAQLKLLCDEIFGEENFISTICVKMSHLSGVKMSHLDKKLPKLKEYLLMYARDKYKLSVNPVYETVSWEKAFSRYKSFILKDSSDPDDFVKWKVISLNEALRNNGVDVNDKNAVDVFCFEHACEIFRTARNRSSLFTSLPNDNLFREIKTSTGLTKLAYKREEVIFANLKLSEDSNGVSTARESLGDIWCDIGINNLHNEGGVSFRNGKKPLKLVKRVISMCTNKDALVLDFMAGSGTTGQAVLELNKDDGGNRKFILCTNNENNICSEITFKRLQNVIIGYTESNGTHIDGIAENLRYFTAYDFVEAKETDANKRKLVNKSTEMLCIKENAFNPLKITDTFKVFKGPNRYLGIVFYEDAIQDYVETIKSLDGHFNTYVFSLGDDTHENDFLSVKDKTTLCAIPEVILKVYREIFK